MLGSFEFSSSKRLSARAKRSGSLNRTEILDATLIACRRYLTKRTKAILTANRAERYNNNVPTLTIELPEQQAQTAFNLRRWQELLADPELAKVEGRIETDRHGHIIMSPPAAASHGSFQFATGRLLADRMRNGRVLTECPISTADGVKVADVVWASP